jgi:hypothetical protein
MKAFLTLARIGGKKLPDWSVIKRRSDQGERKIRIFGSWRTSRFVVCSSSSLSGMESRSGARLSRDDTC